MYKAATENTETGVPNPRHPRISVSQSSTFAILAFAPSGLTKPPQKTKMLAGKRHTYAVRYGMAAPPCTQIPEHSQTQERIIMELLKELVETKDTSIIISTHDAMVQSYADQNFHIQDGKLANTTVNGRG